MPLLLPPVPGQPPLTDAVVEVGLPETNPWRMLACVWRAIVQSNHPHLAETFLTEARKDNFRQLIGTCRRYVTVRSGEEDGRFYYKQR